MTGQPTGIAGQLRLQRDECEQSIRQLIADSTNADSTNTAAIGRLRRSMSDSLAALVVSVAGLQAKAERKLADPSQRDPSQRDPSQRDPSQRDPSSDQIPRVWWVTEKSLQQATAWQVAKFKSNWFGESTVFDLCCGIGGDAIQLSRRGPVVAIDSDPLVAEMANANLDGHPSASVWCRDVTKMSVPDGAAIHIDPDRRVQQQRRTRPDDYQPAWQDVRWLVDQAGAGVVKLAPAAQIELDSAAPRHRCWISLQRTVREQSLLCGELVERAGLPIFGKSAVLLNASGESNTFIDQDSKPTVIKTADIPLPMSLLIDPDPAIRAAGLTEAFAHRYQLRSIGRASGFLTADEIPADVDSMAVTGRMVWSGPCDDRKIRKELRRIDAHPTSIKVRGSDHDPAKLIKRLRGCGEQGVTLWIGRSARGVYAAITTTEAR